MLGQETFLQVFVVTVAVGPAWQGSDFVVDAFQWADRDRVVVPVEEAPAVFARVLAMTCIWRMPEAFARRHHASRNFSAAGFELWFQNCRKSSLR